MFAARAACVRDFLASGAIGEVAVARRAPDGVKRLKQSHVMSALTSTCTNRVHTYSAEDT